MAKLSILVLGLLVFLGCGSGSDATENQGKADDAAAGPGQARDAVSGDGDAASLEVEPLEPGPEPDAGAAGRGASEATGTAARGGAPEAGESPAASDDFAKAEARATRSLTSKPAVDTSQLKDAPAWSLQNLEGGMLSSADLMGKVVLVDFWATWCGPCRRSIPHLVELSEEYKDRGVVVVGVSLDQQDPQKVVKPFVEQYKISYPVVMGTMKTSIDYGVRGIPTAFIISQDGKVYRKLVGLRPPEHYEEPIKALLGIS